ncbi:MAG: tRNA lysidine(34) synthetase TilS, partial [bacterium]|nr:tRNA lysidine(34) synthetase TilS [bacterium]
GKNSFRAMKRVIVAAVSGGPDSVYLMRKLSSDRKARIVVGHVNYGTRGTDSEKDQKMVEKICKTYGYYAEILLADGGGRARKSTGATGARGLFPAGFEKRARDVRYRFLRGLSGKVGAEAIALAHTADDQVETILMRVFEGAGIGGLKGIPRDTGSGIVRPILDVWKEDILDYLKKRKIPYRIDRSNLDPRFERNWVRNVLIPLLEKRYGRSFKKRIFALGERFRELDDYLEGEAGRWIRRNVKSAPAGAGDPRRGVSFQRARFTAMPSVLRMKILQRICFDRLWIAPNERLLAAMDRNVCDGGPSARVNAGKGWKLANRYEEALFVPEKNGHGRDVALEWESRGKCTAAQARRLAAKGDCELFDAALLKMPLAVRPLRAGDRIRPFGATGAGIARDGEKKVKEILIDRKVPRDDRWGRPVVCDADGAILWIPGVLRSAHAPVTPETRKTALLRIRSSK